MKYKHYDRLICLEHRVKLHGWPDDIKFDTPYQIGRISDLEKLRDALRSGECKWVKLKPDEYKELQKKLEAEESATARQTRSDKGKKRKRNEGDGDETRGQPKKKAGKQKSVAALKAKVAKQLPAALSKALKRAKNSGLVGSDDSGESSDSENSESDDESVDGGGDDRD